MTQHGAPLLGDREARREHGSDGRVCRNSPCCGRDPRGCEQPGERHVQAATQACRSDLTIAEAEAWRAGWEACQRVVVAEINAMAARLRSHASSPIAKAHAAAIETAADALARMEMPAARREPTGWEHRG